MQSRGTVAELLSSPPLKASEFEHIRQLAYDKFGLDLKDGKQGLVVTRLTKELRRLGLTSFDQYLRHLSADRSGEAMIEMADALTTNFTSFLREQAHFQFLRNQLLPQLPKTGPVEIWSAASSTGEEVYSILFTVLETLGPSADVRLLGTDISTRALRAANDAVYHGSRLEGLPPGWLQRYFLKGNGSRDGSFRVRPEYRAMVTFRRFNLVVDEPGSARFPAIFCRNVAIYFDKPTQAAVARKLANVLAPGGHLFIGHSESLSGMDHGLAYVQPALYRKPGKGN
ncbi:MAG TPA: protein-glutamate O-methyltransferase CheR [Bryobacteraceae bacterium]|nr:protein-glutamate O-methyltransferase CheR [Bryobacteraceae bacterium]